MKSFNDYIMEDASPKKDKEEKPEPKKDFDEDSFRNNGIKEIVGLSDLSSSAKGNQKQMRFVSSFGSKKSPHPYEVTFTSVPGSRRTWNASFTRGFDKLKEKDKDEVENCLDVFVDIFEGFCFGGGDVDWNEPADVTSIYAKFKYNNKDMMKMYEDFINKFDMTSLKRFYNVEFDDWAGAYQIHAKLKKKKKS